jgi:predicted DNA-binding transcriptional regulator YafY
MRISPDLHLRRLLDSGEPFSLHQLQEELRMSERQVRRIIGQLRGEGAPVLERRVGRQKQFYLPVDRQQVTLTDLRFDGAELRALAIAAKASRSLLSDTPHAPALTRAFDKLLEQARPVTYLFDFDEPNQAWHFAENPPDLIRAECFQLLETAIDQHQVVCIDYFTARDHRLTQGRKINPYCFAKRGRAWLLIAYCHQKKALRNFSLTRISSVDPVADEYFDVQNDFVAEDYFQASLGAINSGVCEELRLLVEADRAIYFRERQYHPTQLIEEQQADGRLVVSYELEGFEEMRSFCQAWGVGITVLAPASLRERLYQEAQSLVKRYGTLPSE